MTDSAPPPPESLEDRIKRHEGYTSVPKPDTGGMYEIGYGHDITADQAQQFTDPITPEEGEAYLEADICYAKGQMHDKIPWTMQAPQVVQDVVCEMVYQIGIDGVLEFTGTLAAMQAGDYATAADHMLASLWCKQTPVRCKELAGIIRSC